MARRFSGTAGFVLCAALLLPAGAGARTLPADHPLLSLLAECRPARGREHRALLVVPVEAPRPAPEGYRRPATAGEAYLAEDLSAGEPGGGNGRGPVEVYNWSRHPVLALAGEVLAGGVRDRVLGRDALLPPGRMTRIPAIVGDREARRAAERSRSLAPAGLMAPDLVRFAALAGGPEEAVEAFLGDAGAILRMPLPRESLAEMAKALLPTAAMREYRDLFARVPDEAGRRVVGAACFVNDRFAGLDLFPTNEDFRAHWPTILTGLALHAALIDRYAAEVGLLFPAARDPDRFQERVKQILRAPFGAVARESAATGAGSEISLRKDGVTVCALLDAGLVHAVFLADPEEEGLPDAPPPGTATTDTPADLLRRGDRARLTEAERRLLERMLGRRGSLPDLPADPAPTPR